MEQSHAKIYGVEFGHNIERHLEYQDISNHTDVCSPNTCGAFTGSGTARICSVHDQHSYGYSTLPHRYLNVPQQLNEVDSATTSKA